MENSGGPPSCGKPARRSLGRFGTPGYEHGCCDDCFAALVAMHDGVFGKEVLEELYPLVTPHNIFDMPANPKGVEEVQDLFAKTIVGCGHRPDAPDCECWEAMVTFDQLRGPERVGGATNLLQATKTQAGNVKAGYAVELRRAAPKALYKTGEFRVGPVRVFDPGPVELPCALMFCGRTFTSRPRGAFAIPGGFTSGFDIYCSPCCRDFAGRVAAVQDRLTYFGERLAARRGANKRWRADRITAAIQTGAWVGFKKRKGSYATELAWARQQTLADIEALRCAWNAVQHEPAQGDERVFALLPDEDES
jgi:hypothetical protein